MKYKWDEFLAEGDEMFEYMTRNFEIMFDGESDIKHFSIRYGTYCDKNINKIKEEYGDDIQKKLIIWIKNEIKNDRFFEKSLWKPFRELYDITDMFFGYRYFFQYREHYFQLALYYVCLECKFCKYCNYCDSDDANDDELTIHFELALYNSKNGELDILFPGSKICIPSDNKMPDYYWNME
jgi:hypothetical protein